MKKRLTALLLSACITLTGCASILERDYVSVTPHSSTKTDVGSSSVLRVESYQELVNSLIYFISTASDSGVIRLYMDSGVVEEHLHNARQEILQEYPLAVYAVENISFETDPLVTYVEARVDFTYRRTQQQVAAIQSVTGVTAVRSAITNALTAFSDECVLNISYFDQDAAFVRSLVRQAYYTAPASALEYPEVEVNIYPDSGRQRIVEVLFHYETDLAQLTQQALLLEQSLQHLADSLSDTDPISVARAILAEGGHSHDGGSSPYNALLNAGADHEGLSLAMAALCDKLDIPCKVAEGLLGGETHFWNVVHTDDGWRHIDLSQLSVLQGVYTDDQWRDNNYLWVESELPVCS